MTRWEIAFWFCYSALAAGLATAALYATTLPKGTP